jgi:PIN domain nuclease of toxin-antitoxin system
VQALAMVEQADAIFVSPITFFGIGQKVRIGKWPEMVPFVGLLPHLISEQGGLAAALGPEICLSAAMMDCTHRDSFDRILAAVARHHGLPLISADTVFDELRGRPG